jgi:hypothetical protein
MGKNILQIWFRTAGCILFYIVSSGVFSVSFISRLEVSYGEVYNIIGTACIASIEIFSSSKSYQVIRESAFYSQVLMILPTTIAVQTSS